MRREGRRAQGENPDLEDGGGAAAGDRLAQTTTRQAAGPRRGNEDADGAHPPPQGRHHQHKRKADILRHKLGLAQAAVSDPSICFGTKDLFLKQFELEANGYEDLDEWRNDWRAARCSGFLLVGASAVPAGNEIARLKLRADGLFDLELRLPLALSHMAQRRYMANGSEIAAIDFRGLSFNHGHDAVVGALARAQPVSFRFCRDRRGWRILVTVDEAQPEARFDDRMGCIGVDFNADHVAATLADRYGKPRSPVTDPLPQGKGSAPRRRSRPPSPVGQVRGAPG